MSFQPDRLAPWLPFLLPAALIGYAAVVTIGGRMLRAHRKREAAKRLQADPRQPWHRWLDEINRDIEEDRKPGAVEKWRE